MAMDKAEQEHRTLVETSKTDAFDKWLGASTTKLMISILPPLETDLQRECFTTLLRAAFDTGYNGGETVTMLSLLRAVKEPRS
jgi:hypothetical protein